jgi:hypothetical protein
MIVSLQRWITEITDDEDNIYPPIIPQGYYELYRVRLDRIDAYSISDDKTELILTIGGNEIFFDYSDEAHIKIRRYFDLLDTENN